MVVPYVGTWIEIVTCYHPLKGWQGRSLRGNVDRNIENRLLTDIREGRSLRGNVDRNYIISIHKCGINRRSLRGNVDRNAYSRYSD